MSPTRYETVLAALDAGVVVHAPDTTILEANPKAHELLGLRHLDGRTATDPAWRFMEEDHSAMALERFPVVRVIASGEPVHDLVMIVQPPDRGEIIAQVSALPRFDVDGTLLEVVVTFIDVTDREKGRRQAVELSRRLATMAETDDLTGLLNRRGIIAVGEKAIELAERRHSDLAFLMIDLDRFKQVNDRFGHAGGDALLLTMAEQIRKSLRREDSVGRFGGEEFLAVLPGADLESAQAVAERVRTFVEDAGGDSRVTASIGVAVHLPGEGLYDQIRRADLAMYRAKESGRNAVRH